MGHDSADGSSPAADDDGDEVDVDSLEVQWARWGPSPIPRWWRLVGVVPLVGAVGAFVWTDGDSLWVPGTFFVLGAALKALGEWELRRRGHPAEAAEFWMEQDGQPGWVLLPMLAWLVWVYVGVVADVVADPTDWWAWGVAVIGGLLGLFGLVLAFDGARDWLRRRREAGVGRR